MSTTVVYYPHAIYLPGGTVLTLLSDVQAGHNFQDLTEFAAGQAVPQFTGTHQAAPDNRFSSAQVKAILDATTDYNVAKDYSALGNVDVEYRAGINLGVRKASGGLDTFHIRARAASNTMLCWESFTARQGQIVELKCRLVHVFNLASGVDPLVFTNSVALVQVSALPYLFTLGPVKLNGTFLNAVEEVTWNNNIEYEEVTSDGDGFLSYCGIKKFRPTLSIMTRDLANVSTFGTRGTALSALSCFLRKKLQSGINVADATAEHIKLSGTVGTIKSREAQAGDTTRAQLTVDLMADGPNLNPFAVSTLSAIS